MAENTSTYKAIVDVETEGVENIDLLNKKIKTSIGEFDNLNEAISKTQDTLGKLDPKSETFKNLRKELNQLQDQLETTQLSSNRFVDALASTQGVTGLVGQSIKGLGQTMKVFAANPIIAAVTLLAGLFVTLRESLSKTAEGQETLNKISAAFGKILGPVFAIIEKVALPIFEKFAELLELVANGFNRFAKFLGISEQKIEEASRASSDVLQKAYDEEQQRQEDLTKKQEEEQAKRLEAQKKVAEDRKKLQEDADKILLESQLSLLSDRDRELKERELRFQQELKTLKAAGVTDLIAFEEEYRNDELEINKKFDDELLKQQEEQNKKREEAQKKADEEAKKNKEEFDKFILESEQFKTDALGFIQDQQVSNVASVGNILTMIAGKNKKLAIAGLVLQQGASIAGVVIDTARGIAAATAAAAPFIANPITAIPATANLARVIAQQKIAAGISIGGIIAGAAKGISDINKAQIPGESGGGRSGGGGGVPNIPTPTIAAANAPQIEGVQQQQTGTQIASTISESQQRPLRAYVVSQDISSQQALDRRSRIAATFG